MHRLSLCALLASAATAWGADMSSPLHVMEAESNEVMTALMLDPDGYEALRTANIFTMTDFVLDQGLTVDLSLERKSAWSNDARLISATPDGEVELDRPELSMFSGTIVGAEDSLVFLTFSPYGVEGYIDDGHETWVISSGPYDGGLPTAIYNLTTLPEGVIDWYTYSCQVVEHDDQTQAHAGQMVARGNDCWLIEWAVETDQEFLGLFGGDQNAANTYMATLFGAVGEIYERDFNTQVEIVYSRLWTSNDPWTSGSTSAQLDQFVNYWNANQNGVQRDLAHFLSGRGLGGGIAYLSVVCNGNFGYGLSANLNGFFPYPIQNNNAQNWDLMVVAHEGGHNVGSPHTHDQGIDNCAGGDCSVTPNGTIMSYCHLCPGGLANVRMEFHPNSINNHILPFMSGTGCTDGCDSISFDYPFGVPDIVETDGSSTIGVIISGSGALAPVSGTGMFHYDTGSGFTSMAMTETAPNTYTVNVPATDCGTEIAFYFSTEASDGNTYRDPAASSFNAGAFDDVTTIVSLNFETDGGFTVTSENLTDGGWDRGVPVGGGDRQDPASDYDGSGACWLTDNVDDNSDVDGGPTRITSPAYDLSGTSDPVLSYARFFGRDDNEGDDALIVELSSDNGVSWVEVDRVESGNAWATVSVNIADHVALTSAVRIRVSIWDNPNNSVVEGGFDAMRIEELACDNGCAADWNGDTVLDIFDITGFLASFDAGAPEADINGDTVFDIFDITGFLNIFSNGC
ncbi:MAG: hypothetical protein KDB69_07795 [Acidimicrobiia bacterium]|nr:hypothetical protein [Acidimicrobiia bacterium]